MATKTTHHPITISDEVGAAVEIADACGAARSIRECAQAIGHIVRIVRVSLETEPDPEQAHKMFLAGQCLINEALEDVTTGALQVTSSIARIQKRLTRPLTYDGVPAHLWQDGAR